MFVARPRQDMQLQDPLEKPVEAWTHPRSGEKYFRRCLGSCLRGRLAVRRDADGFTSLYWLDSTSNLRGAFDRFMWATLGGEDHKPVHLGKGLYRLTRLRPGDYQLEQADDGSMLLFKLTSTWISRPQRRNRR